MAAVLEMLAAQQRQPERQAALLRAASGLRAAVNKAQAVLAITACYNVINAALKQASASGKGVRGMGGAEGLGLVVGIVARAVRLIQRRGDAQRHCDLVARMQRSEIRCKLRDEDFPDFASLHPGYALRDGVHSASAAVAGKRAVQLI